MADPWPSPELQAAPTITDMDMDSLVHCASYLDLHDVLSLASSCKYLNRVAYSDPIWHRFFRERWPYVEPSNIPPVVVSGAREAYLARYTSLHKFQFLDPSRLDFLTEFKTFHHIYLNKNEIVFSQGSMITILKIDSFLNKINTSLRLRDHRARITCMRHNTSLLVSMAKDSKLLIYVAAGSSVSAVDLRTMGKVFSIANTRGKLYSFEVMPSKYLVCTGGTGRAMLWDIRKSSNAEEAGLVTEMDGHTGPVTQLYMDRYKIVSGGPEDSYVNVWETDTASQITSLICSELDESGMISGCSAMAVDGCRVVTCSYDEHLGLVRFRDFDKATYHISLDCNKIASKFWGQESYGNTDESDD